MIRRGPHEWQTERDIDGVIEGKRLDRDQRLIVVHAQSGIVARARVVVEQRVGGQRPADIDAVGLEPRDGGRNDRAVLFAERTFFAGVGIEPGYGEPRPWNAEPAGKIARYDAPGLDHKLGRQMCEDFAQRQMDRHRHDRQLGRPQHHDRPRHLPVVSCASVAKNSVCPGSAKPHL